MVLTSSLHVITEYVLCFHLQFLHSYSNETRAKIVKYACQHGTKVASAVFSWKLSISVNRSSVNSMKKAYMKCLQEVESDKNVTTLPSKKRFWPCLFGNLENHLALYLFKILKQGEIVTASIVVAATCGILMSYCPTQLP